MKRPIKFLLIGLSVLAVGAMSATVIAQRPSFEVAPNAPPTLTNFHVTPSAIQNMPISITVTADDISGVATVQAYINTTPTESVVTLYDDGSHGDGAAGDKQFGNQWNVGTHAEATYTVDIEANDLLGFSARTHLPAWTFDIVAPVCNPNGVCDCAGGETQASCPADCVSTCNPNDICESDSCPNYETLESCPADCSEVQGTIFITSNTYNGNLGGLAGADQKCQTLADASTLVKPGIWKAWLSTATESAVTRMIQLGTPYRLPNDNNDVVANNWSDLTDGTLLQPIVYDENGNFRPLLHSDVWTKTLPNGTRQLVTDPTYNGDCSVWTSSAQTPTMTGTSGNVDSAWTQHVSTGYIPCSLQAHLYCLWQQSNGDGNNDLFSIPAMVAPLDGGTITSPDYTVSADVVIADPSYLSMEFSLDSNIIGTQSSFSSIPNPGIYRYSLPIDLRGVTNDSHTFGVKVWDRRDPTTFQINSATANVAIPVPAPTVSITYPTKGQTLSKTVAVAITAQYAAGNIDNVELYDAKVGLLGSIKPAIPKNNVSVTINWDTTKFPDGNYNIYAMAYSGTLYGMNLPLPVVVLNASGPVNTNKPTNGVANSSNTNSGTPSL
jgi:hypothetical protein